MYNNNCISTDINSTFFTSSVQKIEARYIELVNTRKKNVDQSSTKQTSAITARRELPSLSRVISSMFHVERDSEKMGLVVSFLFHGK